MIETIRNAWKIPELRPKILFTVFALLKLIPLCLLLNCSASVQVSFTIAAATLLLGLLSGQLRVDNMFRRVASLTRSWKEVRLVANCLSSDFMTAGGGGVEAA